MEETALIQGVLLKKYKAILELLRQYLEMDLRERSKTLTEEKQTHTSQQGWMFMAVSALALEKQLAALGD